MTGADETIIAEATAWHLASEREAMDWSGFTAWLEADPRHRTVYDEVALTDAALEHHRDALAPLDEDVAAAPRRRWPFWVGGALAASLAAVLVVPQLAAPAERTYATGATAQTIALADGSHVVLGPRSELTVAGRHGERLALRGGAYFEIRHVPDRAMAISAGGLQVTDIGTRFEIQSVGNSVRVEVAEGRLEVRGDALAAPVELTGGRRILFDPANRLATVGPISPQDVGEWREGRLSYDAAPLSLVAADLARYAGTTLAVPPPLASRRFSGTLSIHNGDTAARDLAQLMGLQLTRSGGAYSLRQPG